MIVEVADPTDPRLDDYRRLNDQPHRRRIEGDTFFIAEGFVAVDRLVESDHRVRSVLVARPRLERFAHTAALAVSGVPVLVAERDVIAEAVGFDLHRGIVAAADRRPLASIDELLERRSGTGLLAGLEGLNDAENLGAIARAARAFGVDGLVLDPTCTDPYSRRTVRVSMGEVLGLPVARAAAWPGALDVLRARGVEVWAMTPAEEADDLWTLDRPERVLVLLGAEGPGLTSPSLASADRRVRIPIAANVDSLNVGHAAAITFAALTRQR